MQAGLKGSEHEGQKEARMPIAVSGLSRKLINEIRLEPEEAKRYAHPVYVDTEQITGYFKADKLREMIGQREDLSYLSQTVLNEDLDGIPGFTFERIQKGEVKLGEFLKKMAATSAAKEEAA
jgi:hypothetical protein